MGPLKIYIVCIGRYLFELKNSAQSLHHRVLLVVLYQVG